MTTYTLAVLVEIVSASVWIGSMVCLAVVSRAARRALEGAAQVAFFRAVGRRYAVVGMASLLGAVGAGLALAWPPATWSASTDAAVAIAGVLVATTSAGMVQARAMGTLRERAMRPTSGPAARAAVHRGRRVATSLRLLMAAETFAIVVLAARALSR
jgi:uncharacterized membrane protein